MACLQMYNQQNNNQSPRLSFSSDFVESNNNNNNNINNTSRTYRDAPVSSDFEFSMVSKNSMMMINSADELFSQGRLLPLKENSISSRKKMITLKDELEVVDELEEGFSLKPPHPKSSSLNSSSSSTARWKGFLGLKKSHKNGGSSTSSAQQRTQVVHAANVSQEMMNDGSTTRSSCSKN